MAEKIIEVLQPSDVSIARVTAQKLAATIGFGEKESEEIAIAVTELASNLIKHARGGRLTLIPLANGTRVGIRIESQDSGPGIADVEQAIADGFSTTGSLGYGLGAVNRLMDTFDITSQRGAGTHVTCERWLGMKAPRVMICPLEFGAASRAHPAMQENGDSFVIKQWNESALVGVIDGLGHGQFAHRAAITAQQYVEAHYNQPLDAIFQGVARACRATRGVVMALARFDWRETRLAFASVGNIQARVFGNYEPMSFVMRRGVLGGNARNAVVTNHHWDSRSMLVLHSDGLSTHWRREDFSHLADKPASVIAQRMLQQFAKDDDDATVVVVKGTQ